jgi:non-ribosomal peptide synthetase component E (peptide arylation enzyme)
MSELLHGLLHDAADMSPGSTAVVDGHREMTYLQLDRAANRIAHDRYEGVCVIRGMPGLVSVANVSVSEAGILSD